MGHASTRAALIYLHSTDDRQRTPAEAVGRQARTEMRKAGKPKASELPAPVWAPSADAVSGFSHATSHSPRLLDQKTNYSERRRENPGHYVQPLAGGG